jgi:hypothetical protein
VHLTLDVAIIIIFATLIMGRILAIDYGKKRCGLAVTDPARIISSPLETVSVLTIWKLTLFFMIYQRISMNS